MGVDESNHGRYPEIFVAVFSKYEGDIIKNKNFLTKKRGNANPLKNLGQRTYTFIQVSKTDYKRIPKKEFFGVVLSSLFQNNAQKDFSNLEILVDGERNLDQETYALYLLSRVSGLHLETMSLKHGAKYDEIYGIVNMADSIANYIFRNFSPKKMAYNHRYRDFIK